MEDITNNTTKSTVRLIPATDHINLMQIEDRVLADYLPQMIWIVRASDRRLLYANPSFRAYFGPIEPGWDRRSERFHRDDLHVIDNAFAAVISTGATPKAEVRILGSDGNYRWHKMRLVPVRHNGEITEWVVTAVDIHDLVQTREMLQDTTDLLSLSQEAAGAGSWDLSLIDGTVKLSRESARMHGVGDHDFETDLEGWTRIVNPDDAKTVLDILQTAVDTRTTFNGEFRVQLADGSLRWLSGIGRAYYNENGDPVRMLGLNFDVTDRKTAETALLQAKEEAQTSKEFAEQARQQAEYANMAKGGFLANMSHEIRTPLTSIIGYADLLMEDIEYGSPTRRKLEVVQEAGAALLTIVNDILDFSKIEVGQIELHPTVFSPRALVENVCSMLSGMALRKEIALVRQIGADVPAFMLGDEGRLRQILLNLVNNAVKFTDKGRVAIHVTAEASGTSTGVVSIKFTVKDSGIGIALEQQTRLFQRFSQVDASINRRFGGSGLGLAICKQLIDLMRGEIAVESKEGEGATFWFRVDLPVAKPLDDYRREGSSNDLAPIRSARVLLVEDVIVNQDLAKAVLERAGHIVHVASNGSEAVELVRSAIYDVVLMDVQMPVMDGITATQTIRASEDPSKNVPIIGMTANVLPQQIAGLKKAGMNDHVGKPFRKAELLAVIELWSAWPPPLEGSQPDKEFSEDRFDAEAFGALEDLIGEPAFRVCAAKFSAELTTRLSNLTPCCDRQAIARDAHSLVQAAGLFGFAKFLSLLRQIESASDVTHILGEVEKERQLVIGDLDRYLMTAGGRTC